MGPVHPLLSEPSLEWTSVSTVRHKTGSRFRPKIIRKVERQRPTRGHFCRPTLTDAKIGHGSDRKTSRHWSKRLCEPI